MGCSNIRVMCIDDSPDVTALFSRMLDFEPGLECVGTLANADNLLAETLRLAPHVLLIDLSMPGKDPLLAVTEITRVCPGCVILVYSGYDDPATVAAATRAGARGVVSKSSDFPEIVARIRAVAATS